MPSKPRKTASIRPPALAAARGAAGSSQAEAVAWAGLWLFAAVTTLSIAAQNVYWLALGAWLFLRLGAQRRLPALPPLGWLWLAFLAWTLFTSGLSENPGASYYTWRKWLLAVAAWCTADLLTQRAQARRLLAVLLASAALVNLGASLWFGAQPLLAWAHGQAWAQVSYHWVYDTEWRARGGSGGYMVLAAVDVLLMGLYAGLMLKDAAWRRPWVRAAMAALALGLLLTMTRGAWIAAVAALGGLLLFTRPKLALGLLLGLGLLAGAFSQSVFVRRIATVADRDNESNRDRTFMLQAGVAIVKQRPWTGVGDAVHSWELPQADGSLKHVDGWFRRNRSPEAIAWYAEKGVPGTDQGHLHNTPLQLAVMYGLPGLALAAAFFGLLWAWAVARARDAALDPQAQGAALGLAAGLLALGIHSMTEYNLGSFQTSFTLWFVIGLAVAAVRTGRKGAA
jgi:O-antigen ligase